MRTLVLISLAAVVVGTAFNLYRTHKSLGLSDFVLHHPEGKVARIERAATQALTTAGEALESAIAGGVNKGCLGRRIDELEGKLKDLEAKAAPLSAEAMFALLPVYETYRAKLLALAQLDPAGPVAADVHRDAALVSLLRSYGGPGRVVPAQPAEGEVNQVVADFLSEPVPTGEGI